MQRVIRLTASRMSAAFVSSLLIFSTFSMPPAHADDPIENQFFVTDFSFVAGSTDDNIYVQWDSIGTDPIQEEGSEDVTITTFFGVSVTSPDATSVPYPNCFTSDSTVGSHDLANNETSGNTCRLLGLELGAEYNITVTPYQPSLLEGDTSVAIGESRSTTYTPKLAPRVPTVTAKLDTATDKVKVSWTPGANSTGVTGWVVDTELPDEVEITADQTNCYIAGEDMFGNPTEDPLPAATLSCAFDSNLYNSDEAHTITVSPLYKVNF